MNMTGSTGTPTSTSTQKSPDKASAAITETNHPDPEKVLAGGAEEVGAPTPAAKSPVSPQTGKGDLGTGTSPAGISGIAESARASAASGGTLRSNVAETPGTDTSDNNSGIKPGSVAAQYQRRSEQFSETAEHLRLSANRAADEFRHQGQRGMSAAQSIIKENPVASTIVALGVGLLLGSLLGQGGRGGSQRNY
jgi:ElaB/YqjD/DUF883 family membrane-anchored ribosome-binding protein